MALRVIGGGRHKQKTPSAHGVERCRQEAWGVHGCTPAPPWCRPPAAVCEEVGSIPPIQSCSRLGIYDRIHFFSSYVSVSSCRNYTSHNKRPNKKASVRNGKGSLVIEVNKASTVFPALSISSVCTELLFPRPVYSCQSLGGCIVFCWHKRKEMSYPEPSSIRTFITYRSCCDPGILLFS